MAYRFLIWGYTDDSPTEQVLLGSERTKEAAIEFAKRNPMACAVEDGNTEEEIWTYEVN